MPRRVGIAPKIAPRQLAAVLLLSGAYDLGAVDLDGKYGWFLRTVLWAYSGSRNFLRDERFALASVTSHVTAVFPPSFISSGNGDPLAPQAVALVRKLKTLHVKVDSLFFPDDYDPPLPHEYQFNLDSPAGQEALNRMLDFIEVVVARHASRHGASPHDGGGKRSEADSTVAGFMRRPNYAFIDSKKSPLLLVLRSLSSRKSIASMVPIGLRMRRRMYIFLS